MSGMDKHKWFRQEVAEAIEKAGGVAAVSKAFGVTHQSVRAWHVGERRIPGARAVQLAKLAGVSAETLRPDLAAYWQAIREAA